MNRKSLVKYMFNAAPSMLSLQLKLSSSSATAYFPRLQLSKTHEYETVVDRENRSVSRFLWDANLASREFFRTMLVN